MIGYPKYTYGDIVKFKIDNEDKHGIVYIIDSYGTFFNTSDVCYDILDEDENILYKHIAEKSIIKKIGEPHAK